MKQISAKQSRILDFLRQFLEEKGYPPSIRDIVNGCKISSTSVVEYNLRILEREGYIRRDPEVSRGIELSARNRAVVRVPVIGYIAAGEPIPVPNVDTWSTLGAAESLELTQELTRGKEEVYALKVKGTSMVDALINDGDEVLIPAPDFPLWSAAVNLCGGKPVHYLCDEEADWQPDLADIRSKITAKTKAMVVINPNNPTGAVYSREILQGLVDIAKEFDLVVMADEIYDKIVYDDAEYVAMASLTDDLLMLTLSGLSKSYRVAGFRTGWLIVSGAKSRAQDYIEGLEILSSMRLCSNVPTQHAIQTALGGFQSIETLTAPGGRLYEQRLIAWEKLNEIDGITCVKPKGALYLFPKIDVKKFNIKNDERFVLDLLQQEKVLVVQGSGFNWPKPDHFRIVFLPYEKDLNEAIGRIGRFLSTYRQ